jgi:hypothetical protein
MLRCRSEQLAFRMGTLPAGPFGSSPRPICSRLRCVRWAVVTFAPVLVPGSFMLTQSAEPLGRGRDRGTRAHGSRTGHAGDCQTALESFFLGEPSSTGASTFESFGAIRCFTIHSLTSVLRANSFPLICDAGSWSTGEIIHSRAVLSHRNEFERVYPCASRAKQFVGISSNAL